MSIPRISRQIAKALLTGGLVALAYMPAASAARIKDIVHVEGVRENILMGYGLVVGLNGTGDKLNNSGFTEQSLIAFLERQGVNTRGTQLKTKNVAAVTVTTMLPAFSRSGGHIDVTVSAMGDASNLQGGMLIATPLYGADGEVYAVAQGPLTLSGFKAEGQATTITKGVPTQGVIPNGAIIEREIDFHLNDLHELKLSLRNPDIATARAVALAIDAQIGPNVASVLDPTTIQMTVPPVYKGNVVQLLAEVEQLTVEPDQPARIVIDEASGTIVMGENVRISTVAVAQGNLTVRVEETPQVSQPAPETAEGAQTVVTPATAVTVSEEPGRRMAVLEHGATLKDLVRGLNALGIGPRDLITILKTIKAAGALQAEIEVR
ncbi:MAG: flagellar basal body P-ring protein FlgI [Alphaproteobacteria bacterium]|nr:flagellar basal body P-ring protein FlgI [Alphaproteobacteria bacterium]